MVDAKAQINPSNMLYQEDFESGSTSMWIGQAHGTATVASEAALHGNYGLKLSTDGTAAAYTYAYTTLGTNCKEVYTRWYTKFLGPLPVGYDFWNILGLVSESGTIKARLRVAGPSYSGTANQVQFDLWYFKNGAVNELKYGPVELNRLYCLEFHIKRDVANGMVDLYIDGAHVLGDSGFNNVGYIQQISAQLYVNSARSRETIYVDDIVVANVYVGPRSVDTSPTTPPPTTPPPATPSVKILRQGWQNWQWTAQKFASICDVYQCHYDKLSQAQAIKAIRPAVLVFLYRNVETVWPSESAEVATFKANNWLLKDSGGNYVMDEGGSGYLVDFGNPGYHTWLANWYQGYMKSYSIDGVFLDNWGCENVNVFWSVPNKTPINPRTGAAWTSQNVLDAFKAMVQAVRNVIGTGKLIMVNGVYNGIHYYDQGTTSYYTNALTTESMDGVMCEGLFSTYDASVPYTESQWLESIKLAIWLENNFHGTILLQQSTDDSYFSYNQLPSDMTKTRYEQYVTFCFASRLLTVQRLTTFLSFGYYIDQPYAQSLFQINLGNPSGNYYKDASGLYVRDFANGQVKVNPSSSVRGGLAAYSAQIVGR